MIMRSVGYYCIVMVLCYGCTSSSSNYTTKRQIAITKMETVDQLLRLYLIYSGELLPPADNHFNFLLHEFQRDHRSYGPFIYNLDVLCDPWGMPFQLRREISRYVIVCSGPDRIIGTYDDIILLGGPMYVPWVVPPADFDKAIGIGVQPSN
jgi:hypothetical protein